MSVPLSRVDERGVEFRVVDEQMREATCRQIIRAAGRWDRLRADPIARSLFCLLKAAGVTHEATINEEGGTCDIGCCI